MSSNTPINVWLVIDSLTFGGIETYVLELAKGLKQHEVNVEVLLVKRYHRHSALVEKLDKVSIPYRYLSDLSFLPLLALIQKIRRSSPTLIHAHGYKASLLSKCARVFTGVKQVTTYHAGETPTGKVWFYDFVDRYTAFVSTLSLVVSEKVSHKIPTTTLRVNNFMDDSKSSLSNGEQIAFVGRLSHEKGPDRFLQCAKSHPDLSFHIYGSGPLELEISQLAPQNVQLHGHQDDMDVVWDQIHVLIICSRFEGLPMAALEAMSRGCIVIALDVGDLPKLIINGKNGFLVETTEQITHVLHDLEQLTKEEKLKISEQASYTVRNRYSSSAIIPKLLKLYKESGRQSASHIEKNTF
ncbi:glycosyltransferase family 4 protein [Vibrio neptunius]|uniref:Glycosyltransferase family 4 protein n=1 Tax=Vibrio neptunius TaxID=170651 RepID=A0ABS3A054_9VIBR|nr:glycosyltransferase family 4 protein [Vibrio neptunius]MBN3491907.1 glycosyltransferase family 4 protein [Vibrio neptunius]MBN3514398.1 glycosyltransferase family 4 protein [Vibrio neptunius]MBN3548487.1 glycosyltransferase family 4 protein [Vibrio neptunius]MBN3576533.1 glycosyltransferase family 4 protein [Vibrio neptunius]MCH9870197.1 glycosyltransferase family 4 protein [Vibrio neptunius]